MVNIRHVRTWLQAISSIFNFLFRSKIAKIPKDKCSHCAVDLDYGLNTKTLLYIFLETQITHINNAPVSQ